MIVLDSNFKLACFAVVMFIIGVIFGAWLY